MTDSVVLASLSPLLVAMEENLHGHMTYVHRHLPQMTVIDRDDLLMADSGMPADTFNQVARARLPEIEADRGIAAAVEYFRRVRRCFAWWVGPGSRPLDLEQRLVRQGLQRGETMPGMALDLARLPACVAIPDGLVVRRVQTAAERAEATAVLAACSEPPDPVVNAFYTAAETMLLAKGCPMQFFLGLLDGEAGAVGELFLGGGVAGLYGVVTRSAFRRRGIGTALCWTMLDAARRQGCATAVLQASAEGEGVYARLGFVPCCCFAEYG